MLALLSRFFAKCPGTRLHLYYEAVTGPSERLLDDEADLILHRVDKSDPRIEWIDLGEVPFVPVVARGYLPFPISRSIRPEQLRDFTQCVIRDTARHSAPSNYFMIEGAHQCTVADHLMKKEVILQRLGWGHLPQFLIDADLRKGRLQSIAGRYLPGSVEELVAARRSDRPHGPVANRLWNYINAARSMIK
jgi:DNA-binding transcriptional LysR family regulator